MSLNHPSSHAVPSVWSTIGAAVFSVGQDGTAHLISPSFGLAGDLPGYARVYSWSQLIITCAMMLVVIEPTTAYYSTVVSITKIRWRVVVFGVTRLSKSVNCRPGGTSKFAGAIAGLY
jgi:hypothetical protein